MINNKVSSRYAQSLLDLSSERNNLEALFMDARMVDDTIGKNPVLKRLLINPVVKSGIKYNIFKEIFTGRISEDMLNFIRFIFGKNREEYLSGIMKKFVEMRNDQLGIAEVEVKTAEVFDEKQTDSLIKKLESVLQKKVLLNFVLDKNIIGGFIARVRDTLYDASVTNQLVNLKKQLLRGSKF